MSDLPIRTYIRRPEPVQAVQVTAENIEAVAEWCGHEVTTDPYAELLDYEAEPVAYQWLRVHGLIGSTDDAEFVKLTENNAGLIMAAFPEQVDSIGTGSSQGVSVGGPSSIEVPFYVFGSWLRVESDHLTPATDEESKALEGEASDE